MWDSKGPGTSGAVRTAVNSHLNTASRRRYPGVLRRTVSHLLVRARPDGMAGRWRETATRFRERAARRGERAERDAHAMYLAFRDERTPWYAKAVLLGVLAYALSPIDPIPDVLPVVGYLDELLLLPVGVALAARLVPDEVLDDCRARADAADPGWSRWLAAAAVALAWALVAAVALRVAGIV